VTVPEGGPAGSADEAASLASAIGFPVAVKILGAAIAHKTEIAGVRLNLRSEEAVREAAETLLSATGEILVERMVGGIVAELIVGIARDPVLGPYLVLGAGGVLAELVGDTATLLLPATRDEVSDALHGLRAAALIAGFRGSAPGDMQAAIDAILRIQDFAIANIAALAELDVNPLMVCRAGAVAADVLMRLETSDV
jgi:succinyl-CoA synthetase beta subunit